MTRNNTDCLWVVQLMTECTQLDENLVQTWQTVSKPLQFNAADQRLQQLQKRSHAEYRILSGMDEAMSLGSCLIDFEPLTHLSGHA